MSSITASFGSSPVGRCCVGAGWGLLGRRRGLNAAWALVLVCVACGPASLEAAEPAEAFLRELKARGYYDLALEKDFDLFYYFLHKKQAVQILSTIVDNPGLSFSELLEKMGIPRTTLGGKVKVLIENGFLDTEYQANQLASIFLKPEFIQVFKDFIAKK